MLHRQFTTPHSTPQCMRIFQQSMRHRHTWHKQVGLLRLAHGLDAYRTPREEAWHQSVTVDSRLLFCEDPADFRNLLVKAGNRLVVVEVMSPDVCESGLSEEAELHWREDQRAQISKCSNLKHSLQRVAAECPDVCFLAVDVDSKSDPMCLELGISTIPSLLFFRDGRKLWEHRGVNNLEQELGEGVLYYGDTAANNEKASTFVQELHTRDDLQRFVRTQPRDVLTVINVSMTICDPCIQIYPAVLALAKSFQGYASFARLIGEEDGVFDELLGELDIMEVPTFLFYRNGEEVGRHVGSSRGDLIGKILQIQDAYGAALPQPERRRSKTRSRH